MAVVKYGDLERRNKSIYIDIDNKIDSLKILQDSLAIFIVIGDSDKKTINDIKNFIDILKEEIYLFKDRMVYGFYNEKDFFERFDKIYSRIYKIIDIEANILGYGNIITLQDYSTVSVNNRNFASDNYEEKIQEYMKESYKK